MARRRVGIGSSGLRRALSTRGPQLHPGERGGDRPQDVPQPFPYRRLIFFAVLQVTFCVATGSQGSVSGSPEAVESLDTARATRATTRTPMSGALSLPRTRHFGPSRTAIGRRPDALDAPLACSRLYFRI